MGVNDLRPAPVTLVDSGGVTVITPSPAPTPVTFAAGASLSSAAFFLNASPGRILMPATWTAAQLTVQTSDDGGVTFQDFYDWNGNLYGIQVAAGRAVNLSYTDYVLVRCLRLRSGTPTAPVAQVAACTLNIVAG